MSIEQDMAKVLVKARSIVESGWHQGNYCDDRGNVCLQGALGLATGAMRFYSDDNFYSDAVLTLGYNFTNFSDRPALKADHDRRVLLLERTKRHVSEHLPLGFESIPMFNDDPGTTLNDVVAVLDKALWAL